jgi:hypothetical protein
MSGMNPTVWKNLAIWELKAIALIWLINGIVVLMLFLMGNDFQTLLATKIFSKLTLLESGITFLTGGIIAFSGSVSASKSKEVLMKSSEQWSIEKLKSSEKAANNYLLLALIILAISITISVLGY